MIRAVFACYRRLLEEQQESEADQTSEAEPPISLADDAGDADDDNDSVSNMGRRIWGNSLLQAVSHSFNLERMIRRFFTVDELQKLKQELSNEGNKQTLLEHLRNNAKDSNGVLSFQAGLKTLAKFRKPAFGGLFNMDRVLELVINELRTYDTSCGICGKTPPGSSVGSLNVSGTP